MDSEFNQDTGTSETEVSADPSGSISKMNSSSSSEQWKEIGEKVSELFSDVPGYVSDFYSEYRPIIVTIGIVLAALITFKLYLAILGAINDVPFLSPLFETVGIGYSGWFVFRYLLSAPKRQGLSQDFKTLKEQVLGKGS